MVGEVDHYSIFDEADYCSDRSHHMWAMICFYEDDWSVELKFHLDVPITFEIYSTLNVYKSTFKLLLLTFGLIG